MWFWCGFFAIAGVRYITTEFCFVRAYMLDSEKVINVNDVHIWRKAGVASWKCLLLKRKIYQFEIAKLQ